MKDNAAFLPPAQDEIRTDLRALFLAGIRTTLEALLEEEIRALVGARRWQRMAGRQDVRNGSYMRRLMTSLGYLSVAVPRSRENGSAGGVLGRYARRTEEVDDAIVAAYVNGVSTRKIGKVTEALMGASVGRSTVSRVSKELEQHVEGLRSAPIEEPMPYLFLDATFLDARWARTVENVAALVAYGVGTSGKRHLLGVTIGVEESEDSWADLLNQLLARGLAGVRLVIADDHAGLSKAVRRLFPDAQRQRCVVHLMRNVLTKTPHRHRGRLARELRHVFAASSAVDARKRLAKLKHAWERHLPEAIDCLQRGFSDATRYFAFPKAHWTRIRSTNGLERLHGELKRRIRAVGAFPDRDSALRLLTAVALNATAIWADRRYLDMSLLQGLLEAPKQEVTADAA